MSPRRHSDDDEHGSGLADALARWDTAQNWMRAQQDAAEPPPGAPAPVGPVGGWDAAALSGAGPEPTPEPVPPAAVIGSTPFGPADPPPPAQAGRVVPPALPPAAADVPPTAGSPVGVPPVDVVPPVIGGNGAAQPGWQQPDQDLPAWMSYNPAPERWRRRPGLDNPGAEGPPAVPPPRPPGPAWPVPAGPGALPPPPPVPESWDALLSTDRLRSAKESHPMSTPATGGEADRPRDPQPSVPGGERVHPDETRRTESAPPGSVPDQPVLPWEVQAREPAQDGSAQPAAVPGPAAPSGAPVAGQPEQPTDPPPAAPPAAEGPPPAAAAAPPAAPAAPPVRLYQPVEEPTQLMQPPPSQAPPWESAQSGWPPAGPVEPPLGSATDAQPAQPAQPARPVPPPPAVPGPPSGPHAAVTGPPSGPHPAVPGPPSGPHPAVAGPPSGPPQVAGPGTGPQPSQSAPPPAVPSTPDAPPVPATGEQPGRPVQPGYPPPPGGWPGLPAGQYPPAGPENERVSSLPAADPAPPGPPGQQRWGDVPPTGGVPQSPPAPPPPGHAAAGAPPAAPPGIWANHAAPPPPPQYDPRWSPAPPVVDAPVWAPPGERGAPTVEDLTAQSLIRQRKRPPRTGWRKALYTLSAHAVNPGEAPADIRQRELMARATVPVRGCYRIAVISLKGGVGKTTMTVCLGATLASLRGDRVIAVDANPDRGTLSGKIPLETVATVRNLLNDAAQIQRYSDVRRYTSQSADRLEVLASESDPAVSIAFSAEDYRVVAGILERFYNVVLTDCGTGLLHSAMAGVLALANQLVVVSSGSVDGARSASATLDWLEAHGYRALVAGSVAVINSVRPKSGGVDLDKLQEHFAARCRSVVRVPYDPHLEEGAEVDLSELRMETRDALLDLAAHVADGFPRDAGGPLAPPPGLPPGGPRPLP